MSSATNSFIAMAAAAAISLTAASCSGDRKAAENLRDMAAAAVEASDPAGALMLLDSLDKTYPTEVEVRREALHLRPKAIEQRILRELEINDSLTVATQLMVDNMKDVVTFKQGAGGVDGYYVATSAAGQQPSSAEGLYPRMSPEGAFYVIASARKGTRSTGVVLSASGLGEAATPDVAADGERNDRSLSMETITFLPAESDAIGSFAFASNGAPLTLTYKSENGSKRSIALPASQAAAMAQLYAASQIYSRARLLTIQKSKLEQQLMLARSQQARTLPD